MTLLLRNFRGMILTKEVIFFYKIVFWVRGILAFAMDGWVPLSLLRDLSAGRTHSKLCGTRVFEYAFDCDVAGEFLLKLCTYFRSHQISYLRLARGLNI
jgi:hypothetical protein